MNNLVYGIIGFGLQIANGWQAIDMIDKNNSVGQNKALAVCGMIAGACAGLVLGACIQKAEDEKKKKEEAKK